MVDDSTIPSNSTCTSRPGTKDVCRILVSFYEGIEMAGESSDKWYVHTYGRQRRERRDGKAAKHKQADITSCLVDPRAEWCSHIEI